MVTFFAILLNIKPSSTIRPDSVAVTSALTGPGTISQISFITCLKSLPDFAIIEGLVVTPSTIPLSVNFFMASISTLSIKNFILILPLVCCDSIELHATVAYFV